MGPQACLKDGYFVVPRRILTSCVSLERRFWDIPSSWTLDRPSSSWRCRPLTRRAARRRSTQSCDHGIRGAGCHKRTQAIICQGQATSCTQGHVHRKLRFSRVSVTSDVHRAGCECSLQRCPCRYPCRFLTFGVPSVQTTGFRATASWFPRGCLFG